MDYGVGNIKSVINAAKHIGFDVKVSCETTYIEASDGIILPGVGACGYAMNVLGPLAEVIRKVVLDGKPLLGICVGFQLLFDESHEHGIHKGLGLISGKVIPIPSTDPTTKTRLTIPHMGWNLVNLPTDMELFEGLTPAKHFAFANSYYADITDPQAKVAYTSYGIDIAASVQKNNIFGCQFHPEKSGSDGLAVLKNFDSICKRNK